MEKGTKEDRQLEREREREREIEREKELPSVQMGAGKRPGTRRTSQPMAMVRDQSQTHTCALKEEATNGLKTLDDSQRQKYLAYQRQKYLE
jgi:hypothetical protein